MQSEVRGEVAKPNIAAEEPGLAARYMWRRVRGTKKIWGDAQRVGEWHRLSGPQGGVLN